MGNLADRVPEIDPLTGTATTGHEWDGIQELNTPLPRWWVITFYATIVWSIGYWIVYPSWPLLSSYLPGVGGYSSRAAVTQDVADLARLKGPLTDQLAATPIEVITRTPELLAFATASGRATFRENCAPCHGAGGGGAKGYPNLNADRWLWGGTLEAMQQTITHGIRANDEQTRSGLMPAFGREGVLKPEEISQGSDYVRSLAGMPTEAGIDLAAGGRIFAENCAACHGEEAKGNREFGAPNLTTAVWLYGSDKASIVDGVTNGHGGVMPAWNTRLSPGAIKAVAVYVHSLGGGE